MLLQDCFVRIADLLSFLSLDLFFKHVDLSQLFAKFIDKYHTKFKIFLLFHLKMCRFVTILILVPQVTNPVFLILLLQMEVD